MGHSTDNEKLNIELRRDARTCLQLIRAEVQSTGYLNCGHWYSSETARDIFIFLLVLASIGIGHRVITNPLDSDNL